MRVTTLRPVWCGYPSIHLFQSVLLVGRDCPIYSLFPYGRYREYLQVGVVYKWVETYVVTPSCADLGSVHTASPFSPVGPVRDYPRIIRPRTSWRGHLRPTISLPGGPALGLGSWRTRTPGEAPQSPSGSQAVPLILSRVGHDGALTMGRRRCY